METTAKETLLSELIADLATTLSMIRSIPGYDGNNTEGISKLEERILKLQELQQQGFELIEVAGMSDE